MQSEAVIFDRLGKEGHLHSGEPAAVFPDWQGDGERWLFLAPHDDDIVIGAGLIFLSALSCGITTHALITTNGQMGYCRPEHRATTAAIRQQEAKASFAMLGLPGDELTFLGFPDCDLYHYAGRRFTDNPEALGGAVGMQNAYVHVLRKFKPTRLFLPSVTDIHPDHRIVTEEMIICMFHAQGNIWPELGAPLERLPRLYEYATYSDFLTPPDYRVRAPQALLEKKLAGIMEYKSQEQIGLIVQAQREAGPIEFFREKVFEIFQPARCNERFDACLLK